MLKKCGWDDFHPDDLTRADRQELSRYDLKLNHIHGARGHCGLNTVHLNEKGHAVYAAASVVIVQDGDKQLHHFQGHDDDVLCIAMSDDCLLAATGQVGEKGAVCIWLWNTVEYNREGRIDFPRDGGIYALSFSPMVGDENVPLFLASIANDEDCTIDIWDMREGMRNIKLLTSIAGDTARILSIAWNPFHQDEALGSLVTCGDKHLQFWTFAQEARSEEDLAASDGREAAVHIIRHQPSWKDTTKQTALCVSFLQNTVAEPEPDDKSPHGYTLTGMQDGSIFLWKWHPDDGSVFVIKVLPAQHDGPIFTLCTKGNYVLTGGNDGFVKIWSLKSFGDGAPAQKQIHLSTEGYSNRSNGSCVSKILSPSVRSLCAQLEKKKEEEEGDEGGRGDTDNLIILAATASNEIYEMMLTANSVRRSRIIVQSHGGRNLQALATHPVKDWFATTGDDCVVRMWNLATRSCSHAALITDANGNKVAGTAVAFRGKVDRPIHTEQCPVCKYGTVEKERQFHCDELAVGTARGDVVIYRQDVDGQLSECTRKQYRSKAITCLQYAPSGTLLAVASEEMVIDILLPDENHRRVGVCKGHNSPISSIDWSMDGEYMQSGDTALDLIFWAMKTQVRTSSSAAAPAPEHKATIVKSDKHVAEFEAYSKPILLYKRRWASNTTPLGWAWLGIYNLGSEAVGLNAVDCFILDRKEKKGLGVSADVTGAIKLFPYPNHATQGRQFLAHSAGVRKVCFSASGKYVVSVGGRDCCAMQWEVVPPSSDDAVVVTVAKTDDDSDDDELDLLRAAPSQSPGKKKK
jgi:microtubule-associated protein-like 6